MASRNITLAIYYGMDDFPQILKSLREERNLTQTALAAKLGFKSYTSISNWEIGNRFPDITNLIAIAKFFNVSIDYLVGIEK
jgi:transcriptional regulator with XRE-family HTH domain